MLGRGGVARRRSSVIWPSRCSSAISAIKDMSKLLPGHGGLMDRLDSVVFAAPTAFMLLAVLAPVAT